MIKRIEECTVIINNNKITVWKSNFPYSRYTNSIHNATVEIFKSGEIIVYGDRKRYNYLLHDTKLSELKNTDEYPVDFGKLETPNNSFFNRLLGLMTEPYMPAHEHYEIASKYTKRSFMGYKIEIIN